jgi:hypothetical protein
MRSFSIAMNSRSEKCGSTGAAFGICVGLH